MSAPDPLLDLTQPQAAPPRRGFGPVIWLALLAVVAVAAIVGVAFVRNTQSQPTSGLAPDFTLTTFDGETLRLSDLRGRIVVLNFWASWCGPCREEAPALEAVWRDYQDRGVTVLGVAFADLDPDSAAFLQEFGVTYPNGPDTGTVISKEQYHIRGVPETFIINQDGEIVRFIFSVVDEQDLRATLDGLLAGNASAS
jgi:cytochrome c biogenesis protein CcmG, thiol:disulfide interchange protein DsbE